MKNHTVISRSPDATMKLGREIGRRLQAGSVIALTGGLGGGKTLLTRGICEGLEVPPRQVNSPTFVLVNEYQGRLPVFHMDMYQLKTESDAVEMGIIDYLARAGSGVMIIEWAERIKSILPDDTLNITFQIIGDRRRRIDFSSSGEKYAELLGELNKS